MLDNKSAVERSSAIAETWSASSRCWLMDSFSAAMYSFPVKETATNHVPIKSRAIQVICRAGTLR